MTEIFMVKRVYEAGFNSENRILHFDQHRLAIECAEKFMRHNGTAWVTLSGPTNFVRGDRPNTRFQRWRDMDSTNHIITVEPVNVFVGPFSNITL